MSGSARSWRCTCCGRYRVDVVALVRAGTSWERLRVSYDGVLLAYCRAIDEVAAHVDLDALRPDDEQLT